MQNHSVDPSQVDPFESQPAWSYSSYSSTTPASPETGHVHDLGSVPSDTEVTREVVSSRGSLRITTFIGLVLTALIPVMLTVWPAASEPTAASSDTGIHIIFEEDQVFEEDQEPTLRPATASATRSVLVTRTKLHGKSHAACAQQNGQDLPMSALFLERWTKACEAAVAECISSITTADAAERCIETITGK